MRTILILSTLLFVGCTTDADETAYWRGRGYAVVQAAVVSLQASTPDNPAPQPTPAGQCARCQGSGSIKPDGRIVIPCPDCDGTGKIAKAPPEPAPASSDTNRSEMGETLSPVAPEPVHLTWHTNRGKALAESLDSGKPLLVVFSLPHEICEPCKILDEQVLTNERTVIELSRFVLLKVGEAEAAEWNVSTFPRCAVVVNGELKTLWKPSADVGDFVTRLEKYQ